MRWWCFLVGVFALFLLPETAWGQSFVGRNVPFKPVDRLLTRLNSQRAQLGKPPLQSRGEAHITVVTPPELDRLAQHLPLAEVQEIAQSAGLARAHFRVSGIGKAAALIPARDGAEAAETYFLVVDAPELAKIRERIQREFVARGGAANAFDPGHYQPHITIGFTHRDLHEDDGVTKGAESIYFKR